MYFPKGFLRTTPRPPPSRWPTPKPPTSACLTAPTPGSGPLVCWATHGLPFLIGKMRKYTRARGLSPMFYPAFCHLYAFYHPFSLGDSPLFFPSSPPTNVYDPHYMSLFHPNSQFPNFQFPNFPNSQFPISPIPNFVFTAPQPACQPEATSPGGGVFMTEHSMMSILCSSN